MKRIKLGRTRAASAVLHGEQRFFAACDGDEIRWYPLVGSGHCSLQCGPYVRRVDTAVPTLTSFVPCYQSRSVTD